MKKLIFLSIAVQLLSAVMVYAQNIVVLTPQQGTVAIAPDSIRNAVQRNLPQLKLNNIRTKIFYTNDSQKFILEKLSRSTNSVSYMLIKYDGNSVAVQDSDFSSHTADFAQYSQKANIKNSYDKTLSTSYDFLFDTPFRQDQDPFSATAINDVSAYATNNGYAVNTLIGATLNDVESTITQNPGLIGMGHIGWGTSDGQVYLLGGSLTSTWLGNGQDLGGTIFFFNSCFVYASPMYSALLNTARARTFIGGIYELDSAASCYVFDDFWNRALNYTQTMYTALNYACEDKGFQRLRYGFGGDTGLIPLTTSGARSRNETWSRNVTLTGSVTVPSPYTLRIKNSGNVNLNTFSIVSTGGTITVDPNANVSGARLMNNGGAIVGLYPTIQATVNAASSNQQIDIPSGTYDESVSATNISNLNIWGAGDNTTITGSLSFTSCPNLTLQAFDCYGGVTLLSCNLAIVRCSVYGTPSETGLTFYYSNSFAQSGIVYNCGGGLWAYQSTGGESDAGADFNSNLISVESSTASTVSAVGSHFCISVTWDFITQQYGVINANGCYYQNRTPRYFNNRGGQVLFYGTNQSCGSQQSVSGPITKMPEALTSSIQSQSDDSAQVEFSKVNASYFDLLRTIREEVKKNGLSINGQLHAEYLGVLEDFKAFIKNNPQSPLAVVALTTASNGYGVFGDYEEMRGLLNEINADGKLAQLKDAARDFMVDYYRNTNDYDSAMSAADAFVNECKNDSDLVPDVILKKGLILLYNKNMPDNAAACFSAIVNDYPGFAAARLAQNELQSMNRGANESAGSTGLAVSQGITMTNYPNPFNPTTTIAYQLPKDGRVTIKIFDAIGREVTKLVDEFKPSGRYSVQFDASRLSSGTYFYSIKSGNYFAVKKMLLLK